MPQNSLILTYEEIQQSLNQCQLLIQDEEHLLKEIANIIKRFAYSHHCLLYAYTFLFHNRNYYKYHPFIYHENTIINFDHRNLSKQEIDGSSIFASQTINKSNCYLKYQKELPLFIYDDVLYIPCSVYSSFGEPLNYFPHLLNSSLSLHHQINKFNQLFHLQGNYYPYCGMEIEFYLMKEEKIKLRKDLSILGYTLFQETKDNHNYLTSLNQEEMKILTSSVKELEKYHLQIKLFHHEGGRNQLEIVTYPTQDITSAFYENIIKIILINECQKYGLKPLFNEVPFALMPGNGHHLNYSCMDGEMNIFAYNYPYHRLMIALFVQGIIKYQEEIKLGINSFYNDYRLNHFEASFENISFSFNQDDLQRIFNEKKNISRNRHCFICFNHDHFEFRGLGSSNDNLLLLTCINQIMAIQIGEFIKNYQKDKKTDINDFIHQVYQKNMAYFRENQHITYSSFLSNIDKVSHIKKGLFNQKFLHQIILEQEHSYYLLARKEITFIQHTLINDLMWYLKDEINLYYLNEEDHLYYAYLEKLKDLQKELNCKVELIDIIKSLEKKNVYLKKMIFPLLEQIKEIASQCASSQNDDFPYSPLNGLF